MMSGVMIVGILLTITPFIFPIVMTLLGLLTGSVQAYIFSILAAVYIAAATRVTTPSTDWHSSFPNLVNCSGYRTPAMSNCRESVFRCGSVRLSS
jgi:hypothetical protein